MDKDKNPLVSVCVTFKGAKRILHRIIESTLNQSYRNVEVVIVDDASADGSEEVARDYASRDQRVKYFRNEKWLGISDSTVKAFNLAKGEFVLQPGADDWLPREFIENGVRDMLAHPDAAGVIPKMISIEETSPDKFRFEGEVYYPPGIYPASRFFKEIYRGKLYISFYAMTRKTDAMNSMADFVRNYQKEISPDEIRPRQKEMALGTDALFFLEIFLRNGYKTFICDNSLGLMKVMWSGQGQTGYKLDSVQEVFRYYHHNMVDFRDIYKQKLPEFYRGMKLYFGSWAIARAIIYALRRGPSSFFANTEETKKRISAFFKDFSGFEIAASALYAIGVIVYILFYGIKRRVVRSGSKRDVVRVFTKEHFLNSEGCFEV